MSLRSTISTHDMKKNLLQILVFFLLLVMVVWLVASRWFGESLVDETESQQPAGPITLRFGHDMGPSSALADAARSYADYIAQESQGRLRVEVYGNQTLGNDFEMLEMARRGELDIVAIPAAKLSSAVPEMQFVDLPFYFRSVDELQGVLDGPIGQQLLDGVRRIGLTGAAFWSNGFKQITANRPILGPDDLEGLRFRIMRSPLLARQYRLLDATPVAVDFGETRRALAEGAVDAEENPLVSIVDKGFYEVQSDLTLSNHAYLGYVAAISDHLRDRLTGERLDLLLEGLRKVVPELRRDTQAREEQFLATIRAAGVQVHRLDEAGRAAFAERLASLPAQLETEIGSALFAAVERQRLMELPEAERDAMLILGLDADLSSAGALAGTSILRGMRLAVEEINQRGGLLGRPLKVLALDHGGIQGRGEANLRQFALLSNLIGIVGGMHSSVIVAEKPRIEQLGVPYLVPWAAASGLTSNPQGSSLFRFSISDAVAMPFLLEHAQREGLTPGLLLERSAWGKSNQSAAEEWASKHDQTLIINWFSRGEEDFHGQLLELREQGAEALILVANPAEAAHVLQAVAEEEEPLPILAHWGLTGGRFWYEVRELLERVDLRFLQTVALEPRPEGELGEFVRHYREYFALPEDQPIPAPIGAVHAHELVKRLAAAVDLVGGLERVAVREALEQLPALTGRMFSNAVPFTSDSHEALGADAVMLARFNDTGHIVAAQP